MKKKIIGIALAVLAVGGVALASGTGFIYSPFDSYTQVQAISQATSGYPINVYKITDKDGVCFVSQVGQGAATISCVPVK